VARPRWKGANISKVTGPFLRKRLVDRQMRSVGQPTYSMINVELAIKPPVSSFPSHDALICCFTGRQPSTFQFLQVQYVQEGSFRRKPMLAMTRR
jgi:hypothetical protein